MTLTHLPEEVGFYDFCCFIKNNFDSCCVFLIVQNTSNILMACYLKNNRIRCLSFLQDMHFSWFVNICSDIANAGGWRGEDLQGLILSLQPLGSRGTIVKMERQGRAFMDSEHAAALPTCPQQDTQLLVPLSWGMNSLTAQNCWFWAEFSSISSAVSLYSKAVCTRMWRKTTPNHQKCECKVN